MLFLKTPSKYCTFLWQRTFHVSVTFLNVFCIVSVDWSETPKISLIVLEWGQNWLKIRDDKDRRSCFLVTRGGPWSICLLSTCRCCCWSIDQSESIAGEENLISSSIRSAGVYLRRSISSKDLVLSAFGSAEDQFRERRCVQISKQKMQYSNTQTQTRMCNISVWAFHICNIKTQIMGCNVQPQTRRCNV